MTSKNFFIKLLICTASTYLIIGQVSVSFAQLDFSSSYEVSAEVGVMRSDFVKARKKAVKVALRLALEQDLREILGNDEFERNWQAMQSILKVYNKYVKSYRFLEAYDDPVELKSRVKLEVNLFQEAISNTLSQNGVVVGLEDLEQVVILINGSNLNSNGELLSFETVPISEILLTRSFVEAGIPVVSRSSLRYEIPKKLILAAMDGNIAAAVEIGSKVGADIVIIGNATSSPTAGIGGPKIKKVRVGLNVKAISSRQSVVVAAKSDFATASENEIVTSEIEAFRRAGKKMTEFLVPAIREHWTPGYKNKEVQRPIPPVSTTDNPMSFGDL